jgi:hypothetical protein
VNRKNVKRLPAKRRAASRAATSAERLPLPEIQSLCEPYLRGFQPVSESAGVLRGCWFVRFGTRSPFSSPAGKSAAKFEAGFFVGYIIRKGAFAELEPAPPECLAGAFIAPVDGTLHRQLVSAPDSLFRGTYTYIGWLTHRKPRFVFSEDGRLALVRHASMREWPASKRRHLSRNFFIETLAWLVRSGLVKRLLALPADAPHSGCVPDSPLSYFTTVANPRPGD